MTSLSLLAGRIVLRHRDLISFQIKNNEKYTVMFLTPIMIAQDALRPERLEFKLGNS